MREKYVIIVLRALALPLVPQSFSRVCDFPGMCRLCVCSNALAVSYGHNSHSISTLSPPVVNYPKRLSVLSVPVTTCTYSPAASLQGKPTGLLSKALCFKTGRKYYKMEDTQR